MSFQVGTRLYIDKTLEESISAIANDDEFNAYSAWFSDEDINFNQVLLRSDPLLPMQSFEVTKQVNSDVVFSAKKSPSSISLQQYAIKQVTKPVLQRLSAVLNPLIDLTLQISRTVSFLQNDWPFDKKCFFNELSHTGLFIENVGDSYKRCLNHLPNKLYADYEISPLIGTGFGGQSPQNALNQEMLKKLVFILVGLFGNRINSLSFLPAMCEKSPYFFGINDSWGESSHFVLNQPLELMEEGKLTLFLNSIDHTGELHFFAQKKGEKISLFELLLEFHFQQWEQDNPQTCQPLKDLRNLMYSAVGKNKSADPEHITLDVFLARVLQIYAILNNMPVHRLFDKFKSIWEVKTPLVAFDAPLKKNSCSFNKLIIAKSRSAKVQFRLLKKDLPGFKAFASSNLLTLLDSVSKTKSQSSVLPDNGVISDNWEGTDLSGCCIVMLAPDYKPVKIPVIFSDSANSVTWQKRMTIAVLSQKVAYYCSKHSLDSGGFIQLNELLLSILDEYASFSEEQEQFDFQVAELFMWLCQATSQSNNNVEALEPIIERFASHEVTFFRECAQLFNTHKSISAENLLGFSTAIAAAATKLYLQNILEQLQDNTVSIEHLQQQFKLAKPSFCVAAEKLNNLEGAALRDAVEAVTTLLNLEPDLSQDAGGSDGLSSLIHQCENTMRELQRQTVRVQEHFDRVLAMPADIPPWLERKQSVRSESEINKKGQAIGALVSDYVSTMDKDTKSLASSVSDKALSLDALKKDLIELEKLYTNRVENLERARKDLLDKARKVEPDIKDNRDIAELKDIISQCESDLWKGV